MKAIFGAIVNFLTNPIKRSILLFVLLVFVACFDFFSLGLARRTFVFYTADTGVIVVEDRMVKHTRTRENDIIRYVEEVLLGPVNPDLLPLFPRETRLISLIYRDRVVYANLTESAAFPPREGGNVIDNFRTLNDSILRNFSYVNNIHFFIDGNAVSLEPLNGFSTEKSTPHTEDLQDYPET